MRRMSLPLVILVAFVMAACGDGAAEEPTGPTGVTTRPPSERTAVAATPAPAEANALEAWVEEFCTATAQFDRVVESTEDGVNPRALDLEARRDRGIARYETHIEGLHELHARLEALEPLPETREYQEAVIQQVTGLIGLLSGSVEFLQTVETHEQIEEELQELLIDVRRLEEAVFDAPLSNETWQMMGRAPVCGARIG